MPYKVVRHKNGWAVKNTETGEIKNRKPYPSHAAALPYLRALYRAESGKPMTGKKSKK